jgi:class 3 adenylate cyclase
MSELPSGTVTFLFSDIEGSTQLLRQLGERWEDVLAGHNRILREAFAAAGGQEVDRQGDAFFAVFARARSAVAAAASAQRALAAEQWPDGADVRVRMGIHTGEPSVGGEGYLGVDVVRAARICAAAHGGQVLVSETTRALVGGEDLKDLGLHHLKDMEHPERLFQLELPDLPHEFEAPRTLDRPQPAPPVPMAGREVELGVRAAELTQRLEGLRPAIEQRVRESLAASGIPQPPPHPARRGTPSPRAPRRQGRRGGESPVFVLAGFVVVVFFAALVAIVYLVLQAF